MKQNLHAVTLVVPDYDAAISFYTEALKFQLLQDIDLGDGKRWVLIAPPGSNGSSLLLAKADGPDQETAIGNQTGGRVGFFLQTDDFYRDHTDMLARGVTFEETPRSEPYGQVAVWRDPFGNRWDLIEFN
ncbi:MULTISPECIES: VOC family protein [unclassified Ruegeria]|uniref:VOC family protein n=1 Tax=unclassified Ruegeria TaxID=2625375 RepID=UPI0014923F0E|nr:MULTISPECIES: VOC family protein [unclassified Ruegeria]NOD87695.1 VOC family protein [Ruegeria sp. HKCCD4318]NOE14065.1 VOC family protein [Ruegeria sp. HKCCD4318-2]NOG08578.1 VOC family protein [Ruegeria sp. HKCCD4315]